MENQNLELSIIIVNYNSGESLKRCLASLKESRIESPYEIIVVDNGSQEGDLKGLEEDLFNLQLIRNPKNIGFARANNQGISNSKGDHLLLLNPDTLVLKEGLDGLVKFMEEHPKAGAAGPMLLSPDGTRQPSFRRFPSLLNVFFGRTSFLTRRFPKNPFTKSYLMMDANSQRAREVDWIMGACMILRRDAFQGVGGFDESFFLFVEDVDLCYRLKRMGWKIYYVPEVRVIHEYGASIKTRRRLSMKEHHIGMYRFFLKHYRYPLPVKGILSLGLLMRLALVSFHNGGEERKR